MKYCCVIKENKYKDFVIVNDDGTVQYYELQDGEELVETMPPTMKTDAGSIGFIFPVWDGDKWIESATAEEIAEWDAEHPAPVPVPTDIEILQKENRLLKAQVSALAEQQEFLEDCLIEVGQVIYA